MVVGKSPEEVLPVTYTFPPESRVMLEPPSLLDPPRYVDAERLVKLLASLEIKTSEEPLLEVS